MKRYVVEYSDSQGFEAKTVITGTRVTPEQAKEAIIEQSREQGLDTDITIERFEESSNPLAPVLNFFRL